MTAAHEQNEHPAATRILACLLFAACVLQSAARASQGCIARVFSGTCCCVAAIDADAPASSCCAAAAEDEGLASGPRADAAPECHCDPLALPVAPALLKTVDATGDAAHRQPAKTLAGALCAWCSDIAPRAFDPRPAARPPESARLPPRPFAGLGANSGRMSRLRVCLR